MSASAHAHGKPSVAAASTVSSSSSAAAAARPTRLAAVTASVKVASQAAMPQPIRRPAAFDYEKPRSVTLPRPDTERPRPSSDSKPHAAIAARASDKSRERQVFLATHSKAGSATHKRRRESSPSKSSTSKGAPAGVAKKNRGRSNSRKANSSSSSSRSRSSSNSSSGDSSDSSDSSSGSSSSSSSDSEAEVAARKKPGRKPRAKLASADASSSSTAAASSSAAAASTTAASASSSSSTPSSSRRGGKRVLKFPGAKPFRLIHKNDYRHAPDSEVVQDTEDDSLCSCTLPADAEALACVDQTCLNRSLLQECPCSCAMGRRCGNQRFRLRDYMPVDVRPVEGKGHGLFATSAGRKGTFVIEYVGEIVNGAEYERRIAAYANSDHFYFMTLASHDSIDATRKGNLSRFINHSCAPNMQTQKWEVRGMQCVGLFLTRDVEADEELTFDYKYERYGGKKQACLCGAPNCAKFLGGKPTKVEEDAGACTCGGAATATADADGDATMPAAAASSASCPVHSKAGGTSAASLVSRALDRMASENNVEAVTRSTRDLLRPLPPRPMDAADTRRVVKEEPTVTASAATSPARASRSAASAAAAAAAVAPSSSSSLPSSVATAAPAVAEPHLRFPRALRKAVPLRLLQLFRMLVEAQRQLQLARSPDLPPLPDLSAHTLRQMLMHEMPQVRMSHLFSTVPLAPAMATKAAAVDTVGGEPPKSKKART